MGAGIDLWAGLDPVSVAFLLAASLVAAIVSALAGLGGGSMLVVVMASVISPPALVPVHGLVALGSILSRAWIFRRGIHAIFCRRYLVGCIVGALIYILIADFLAPAFLLAMVGVFVLVTTWCPTIVRINETRFQVIGAGAGATLLSLCVGAAGIFTAAVVRSLNYPKETFIATVSCCFVIPNLLKIGVFSYLGFSYSAWLPLAALMTLLGVVGTWIGNKLLPLVNDRLFELMVRLLLTGLALRVLWKAVQLRLM